MLGQLSHARLIGNHSRSLRLANNAMKRTDVEELYKQLIVHEKSEKFKPRAGSAACRCPVDGLAPFPKAPKAPSPLGRNRVNESLGPMLANITLRTHESPGEVGDTPNGEVSHVP